VCVKTVQVGYSPGSASSIEKPGVSDGNVSRAETCVAGSNAVSKENDGRSVNRRRIEYIVGVVRGDTGIIASRNINIEFAQVVNSIVFTKQMQYNSQITNRV